MSSALYLVAGLAILLAAVLPSVLSRFALSPPIVLLAAGMAMGLLPVGDEELLDPVTHRVLVEQVTQFAVLLALMGVGLALDRPLRLRHPRDWRRWSATWRLLFAAMPLTILGVWLLGWWGLGLAPATALLLGAVLAPTDPVLAGDVQVGGPDVATQEADESDERHEVRFALTSEAGLNDGLAFPFVYASIFLLEQGSPSSWLAGWFAWELVGKVLVGFLVGAFVGWLLAKLAFRARKVSLRLAEQGEPLLALAALATSFGAAELVGGYGFIAVFTCGMAMRNAERSHDYQEAMHGVVERLERLLTLLVLLCLGIAMTRGLLDALDWRGVARRGGAGAAAPPDQRPGQPDALRAARPRDGQAGAPGDRVLRGPGRGVAVLPRLRRRPRLRGRALAVVHRRVHDRPVGARARRAREARHGLAGAGRGAPGPQPGDRTGWLVSAALRWWGRRGGSASPCSRPPSS